MLDNQRLPDTAEMQGIDAAHHWHPFTDTKALNAEGTRIICRANGVWLTDSEGNELLDGMAGLWCVQVGHGREEIAEAAYRQMRELAYYNTFFKTSHPPAVQLSQELAKLTPAHVNKVFFTNSGSEANDTVFRLARYYWQLLGKAEKKRFVSRTYAYHGSTVAASALGGMTAMHGQAGALPQDVHHIDPPYWYADGGDMDLEEYGIHAARKLERAIEELGAETIAAFIGEPIMGAGGVIIPPDSYWPEIQRICREHDILLIADEVICGFGRTGKWFGSDSFGIEADMMPIAKGLSSGYLPIGGVLISDKIAEVVVDKGGEFFHGYTYSGHPAACAAALENLRILQDEDIIATAAREVAPYFKERWLQLADHPLVGEARMRGMIGALELTPDKAARAPFRTVGAAGILCRDTCFANSLVMRAVRDGMVVSPPLVISRAEIDLLIERTVRSLDQTHDALKRDGQV